MSRGTSWRLALRLARRDALRNRGRSILVLVMIALPVLAVTAADVVIQTQDVSGVESLDRRLGSADAQVVGRRRAAPGRPGFDPSTARGRPARPTPTGAPPTASQVAAALGGARLLEIADRGARRPHRRRRRRTLERNRGRPARPADRRALRPDRRAAGRPTADEVVVNQAILDQGYAVGDPLELVDDGAPAPTIVGVAESTESRNYPVAAGPVGSLGSTGERRGRPGWLVGGGPVSWDEVQALNALGATVLSRAVVTDPPPASEVAGRDPAPGSVRTTPWSRSSCSSS